MRELVNAGFWRGTRNGWALVHHADVMRQSLAAQQAKRDRDKNAQKAKRGRDSGSPISGDVSADVAATQTNKQPSISRGSGEVGPTELLPMRAGETDAEYERRFDVHEAAHAGGGDAGDNPDREFFESGKAAAG
jgi:hypothetical protein